MAIGFYYSHAPVLASSYRLRVTATLSAAMFADRVADVRAATLRDLRAPWAATLPGARTPPATDAATGTREVET